MVQDTFENDGRMFPRGAFAIYREYYGIRPGKPNVGEEVAREIVKREADSSTDRRERVACGVLDPAAFAVISGPSIAEKFLSSGVVFRRADNSRVSIPKKIGGWSELGSRFKGDQHGNPMLFVFSTCRELIRTLPMMLHDPTHPEDLDTDLEDHAVDSCRYLVMSRPYRAREQQAEIDDARSPWLVANAFRLNELLD